MITCNFYARDFSSLKLKPEYIKFDVQRYSQRAIGGPYTAQIHATGDDLHLWEMLEFLRCPVILTDDKGESVWWGYVAEVEIIARNKFSDRQARVRVGANLDTMYNRIAVAWEDIAVGEYAGTRETTDYADNTFSQSEYGTKEGLFSGESASDQTLAEQARDILLAQKAYPVPVIDLNVTGESEAFIQCRGWWDTLNWLYCSVPAELALSYTTVNANYNFGTVAIEQVAQGVLPSGGDINLASVELYIRKVGAPTDAVQVAIYDNPDDLNPTTLIQSANNSISGTDLTTAYSWEVFTFSPEVTLTSGTKYFIVISRSGAADNTNYYQTGADSGAGYAGGTFVAYNGATWAAVAYDAAFRLYDNQLVLTSTQVLSIITNYGQFFTLIQSEVDSGVTSESYRDGDGTAHYEAEQLLQHGTDNNRRMLTSVGRDRSVLIYEEPADNAANYYRLYSDGEMEDNYGMPVRRELAKAGVYARMVDVIPPSVDTTILGAAAVRFIEENEYDVEEKRNYFIARDQLDPFTVGRPLDG